MLKRLSLIFKLFFFTMIIFILQKPLFMLYNSHIDESVGWKDYLEVMFHGIPLDLTVTGYILVIPIIVIAISFFINKEILLKRILIGYFCLISVLVAGFFVGDGVMYDFWRFKLDSSIFLYTDKPGDAVASVSTSFLVWRIVAMVLFAALYIAVYWYVVKRQKLERPIHGATVFALVPILALVFLMIRGGVGEGTANVSNAYYSENQYLNHASVNPTFSMLYSLGKSQDFANEFKFFSDEERGQYVNGIYNTESVNSDTLLIRKRPNILLVIWEGCGAKMVEAAGGEKGVTPNLNKLAHEGVVFTHCYANSFRTDRGLVSIMSGWLGMPTASLMKIPEKCETLPALPRKLLDAGYSTEFWYGGDITFTNMNGYMLQAGIQHTISGKDFTIAERSDTKWGVRDDVLLERLTKDIVNRSLNPKYQEKPWFTSVLTLSSHEPWIVPVKLHGEMRRNSFAYTDMCLGKMIDKIKASDQWNDLLIVILPDHGVILDQGDDVSSVDIAHIPIVMTGGAVLGLHKYDMIMNQSDLAATLLGQLGIDHGDFTFSRDVLSTTYKYPTAFHSFNNGMTFIDSTGVTTYDNNAQKIVFDSGKTNSHREEKAKAILQTLYENIANR